MKRLLAQLAAVFALILAGSPAACSSKEPAPGTLYNAKDAAAVTAAELYTAYSDNPQAADKRFKDELLAVTGTVVQVGADLILDAPEIVLSGAATGDHTRGVDCVFDPRYESRIAALEDGATVTVLGICQGSYEVNVLLLHCQPAEE